MELRNKYEELSFMRKGDMFLLNPNGVLAEPYFFIKENRYGLAEINEVLNVKAKLVSYQLGRVTASLIMFMFDDKEKLIYGQWINKFNKDDFENYSRLNFAENFKIIFLDIDNNVRKIYSLKNMYRGKIGKYLKTKKHDFKWSQEEFNLEVENQCSFFNSKKELFDN